MRSHSPGLPFTKLTFTGTYNALWNVKNLIPHFIQEQWIRQCHSGAFDAYTLFVDMSGFTRLTETLLKQGREGAERLSYILNAIFTPMVHVVYSFEGFIPYFAGDAYIAIFPQNNSQLRPGEVVAIAQHHLKWIAEASCGFPEFQIGIKVGLSVGQVHWGIVGDNVRQFYFKGPAIEGCVRSQSMAGQRQVIADERIAALLSTSTLLTPLPQKGFFLLRNGVKAPLPKAKKTNKLPLLNPEVVAHFLPNAVMEFDQQGEFRNVVAIFLNFKGVDSHKALDEFSTIVLNEVQSFSGYFKEIDFSDKGGVMVVFFGAPLSFENNVERALEFVTALQELIMPLQLHSKVQIRLGIASGIAYTGIVGGEERCQYAAVGDRINIAARAMMRADWGEVLVDAEVQKCRHFQFKFKGNLTYKGLRQRVPTYQFLGKNPDLQPTFQGNMMGRTQELEHLHNFFDELLGTQQPGVALVYGEAGIGKTRLVFELRSRLEGQHVLQWFHCQSDQTLRKPFNPFISFLKRYFRYSNTKEATHNLEHFNKYLNALLEELKLIQREKAAEISQELARTRPVLAALIGLKIEASYWDNLDGRGRYQNVLAALANFFQACALVAPVVIELEDVHWMDNSSREFLNELVKKVAGRPIILLITSRYDEQGNIPELLMKEALEQSGLSPFRIEITPLSEITVKELLLERLDGKVHPKLVKLLSRLSNGNPFYVEQILEYFLETGQLENTGQGWNICDESINVSNSVQSVLTARIDQLSNLVKETIKAAAVIGREFDLPVLTEVMQQNQTISKQNGNTYELLIDQMNTAERAQIWQTTSELRYIFRNSLLREAVYGMQLKTSLRKLHRLVAEAIEKIYANNLEERYVDLVFHYEQAGVKSRLQYYLEKAADHASAFFQNQQALEYYDKLLNIYEKDKDITGQVNASLKKVSILELVGRWQECEDLSRQALSLAQKSGNDALVGQAHFRMGHLLMLKGNYDQANSHLQSAAVFFDAPGSESGMARVYGDLGTLHFRQAKYNDAKLYFIRSIQLSQKQPPSTASATTVATLGLTYMNLGKYDDGIRWQRSHLELCERNQDRQGMAILFVNMGIVYSEKGDYDSALHCLQKGLALCEELGNKQLTSIAIGHIGLVFQRRGRFDMAMQHFESDLHICEELGDKQGISIAMGLIGELFSVMGEFEKALEWMERNLNLATELNYRKGIAKALNTIGDVNYFKKEYPTSLAYYDKAIELSRTTENKLVLGLSLVEKGRVLLAMGKPNDTEEQLQQALEIAHQLEQPELLQQAILLQAQLCISRGDRGAAEGLLLQLLQEANDKDTLAAIHYYLSKMENNAGVHYQNALELYRELHAKTPMFTYRRRIEKLEAQTTT